MPPPPNQPIATPLPSLPGEALESLIGHFEKLWAQGERPVIDAFLPAAEEERQWLLAELVHAELELRLKAGEAARVEEYLQRFPELARQPAAEWELIAAEYRQRVRREPRLSVEEYRVRFPGFQEQLTGLDTRSREEARVTPAGSLATAGGATSSTPPPVAGWPAVPGYEIRGEFGRGGMGVVYRARDLILKRTVALKMIGAGGERSADLIARFRAEAEAVARLDHPHVVRILTSGEHQGQPYFVMEPVEGGSLAAKVRGQPQPPGDAARLVLLLARAVHAAHQKSIVHRDLKPANVLLAPPADEPALNSAYGCPRITDFGLAKILDDSTALTITGAMMGTPCYMAPEQAEGRSADIGPATDVWALGAVLYELLTGRPPFQASTPLLTLDRVRSQAPSPPSRLNPGTPRELEKICMRCLAKNPGGRYATAAALAEDLARFLERAPHLAQGRPSSSGSRRRRLAVVAAGLFFAALCVAALVVIRIQTNRGELVIETDDPNLEVSVKGDSATIYDKVKKRRFVLAAGDYEVIVREQGEGGARFATRRFTITRGGKETFNARLELAKAGAPKGELGGAAHERDAAAWVLSIGGKVKVFAAGQVLEIAAPKDLPAELSQLFEVNLQDNPDVTDAGLAHLRTLPHLATLNLRGTEMSDAGLRHVATLTHLRYLDLANTSVGDAGLAHLKTLTRLQLLVLNDSRRVTASGLAHLKNLTNLTELHLAGTRVNDAGLEHLKRLTNLRLLGLPGTRVTDAGLAHLKGLTQLTYLHLPVAVGDAGLEHLKTLTNLTGLRLQGTRVSDTGLEHLRGLTKLSSLWLTGTPVSDDGLAHLKTLTGLQVLDLSDTRVNGTGLAHLKPLTNLTELHLWNTPVSDAGMKNLQPLINLQLINVGKTRVSDAGLKELHGLTALRELNVTGTRVTAAGIDAFRKALPRCHVVADSAAVAGLPNARPEVVDFREIHDADDRTLEKWVAGLREQGFRPAYLSVRAGGEPRFSALAVRDGQHVRYRYYPSREWWTEEAGRYWQETIDAGFRHVLCCAYVQGGRRLSCGLWVADGQAGGGWAHGLDAIAERIRQARRDRLRPIDLSVLMHEGAPLYNCMFGPDEGLDWDIHFNLTPEALRKLVAAQRAKGWRPDLVYCHREGNQTRFHAVLVENRGNADWTFQMDMLAAAYEKALAEEKARGLRPLAVCAYEDGGATRYAAAWLRYRPAGAPQAKKAPGAGNRHAPGPPNVGPAVTDFREIHGADGRALEEWAAGLRGQGFRPVFLSVDANSLSHFSGVAVRDGRQLPWRLHLSAHEYLSGDWCAHESQTHASYNSAIHCLYVKGKRRFSADLWVADGQPWQDHHGSLDHISGKMREFRLDGMRPIYLSSVPARNRPTKMSEGFRCIWRPDQGLDWHAHFDLTTEGLRKLVAEQRGKGWRPDWINAYRDHNQTRFVAIMVENRGQQDWDFKMDMPAAAYEKALAGQKARGLRPLAVAAYQDGGVMRHAAAWLRYQPAKAP